MAENDNDAVGREDARIIRALSDPKRVEKVLTIACASKHKHGGEYRAAIRRHPRCLANAFMVLDQVGEKKRGGFLDQLVRLIELLRFDAEQFDNFVDEAVEWGERNKKTHPLFRYASCELAMMLVESGCRVDGAFGGYVVVWYLLDTDMASRMLVGIQNDTTRDVACKLWEKFFRIALTVGASPNLVWRSDVPPADPNDAVARSFEVKPYTWGNDPRFTPDRKGWEEVVIVHITCPFAVYEQVKGIMQDVLLGDRFPAEVLACIEALSAEGLRGKIADCIGELVEARDAKCLRAWLPPRGLWRYAPTLAGCSAREMGVLGIVANSGDEIPEITLDVRLRRFDRERDERWVIGPSGVQFPDDVEPGSVREKFRLALALMCVKHIRDWVLRPPCERNGDNGRRSGNGVGEVAYAKLVRLAHDAEGRLKRRNDGTPYRASDDATANAVEHLGVEPPAGQTFRMVPSPNVQNPRPVTFTVSDNCLEQ